jgi:Asp-tRNA(Asn)/Glu-tRNA(Gln) amidotransferase B subunit
MESVYDKYEFGAMPNTNVITITLGQPGALGVVNKETVVFAIRLGMTTKSDIQTDVYFAQKN